MNAEAADEDQLTKKNSQVAQPLHPSPEDLKKFDIIRATQYGAFERCKELIEAGYDVNQMDRENVSLLHWAAINNRKEIVKYYLSKNAIVDKFGGDLNSTPLHWATRQGHVSMVVVLMSYGADPSLYDGEGCSCIHLASQFGHTAIVAYLIAKGQDVDMLDRNGMTPLMWAAYRVFNFDPTRLLLTFGAKVNLADKLQKNTPLHWACQYSNHVIIKILVEAGGNLEAVNAKDQTPLDIAITLKNTSLVSWLRESRAERGLGQKHCLQVLSSNKSVRYSVMAAFPFTALFFIGFIPELTIGWYYKLTLALFAVGIGRITINLFFDHTFTTVIPQFVTLATIFWLYITWIIYLWPYVFSQTALLFALNTAVMVYNLWKVWMTDPGFIVSTREEKIKTIMDFAETQNLNLNEFCSTCVIRRPMRSKHCAVCNKCVAKLDHHCPWVDNCVGALNHKYFLGFLFFVLGALLIYLHSCFLFWAKTCPWNFYEEGITGMLYKILITSPWIAWMATNALAHIIWVTALLCCQLYQIMWLAMTTNERLNIHRYEHFQYQHSDGSIEYKNPFHRGCLKNLNDVLGWRCCGICRPRVIDWRKSTESEETTKQFSHVHSTRENFQFV